MDSLDDILSDKAPEKPAPQEQPKEEARQESLPLETEVKDPVEKQQAERNTSKRKAWQDREQDAQGRVRDPATGQFLPKEAKPEPVAKEEPKAETKPEVKAEPAKVEPPKPPQQELTQKEMAFLKAAQDERNKRQALEKQLAELKPKEEKKGFWDDPEAALAKTREEVSQAVTSARLNTAEMIARSRHPDFDEKLAAFQSIVQKVPSIFTEVMASPDPAEHAYNIGKYHLELAQAGNLDALKEKIAKETEARVRTQIEGELKAKEERLRQERAALPGSLSEARGTGITRGPAWGGPTPLDEILK